MKPYSIAAQPLDSEWFIDPAQSSPGAVALCYRPGRVGPPIIAALAADSDTAARLVSAASRVNDRAGDRVRLATAALRSQLADSAALIETLTARVKELESMVTMHERAASAIATVNNQCASPALPRTAPARRSREVKPDYRTAAECWLAGESPERAKRAEYRKGERAQPVVVLFADGVEIRTSTYLDGQKGKNAAAQFARASRQFVEESKPEYPAHELYRHIAQSLGCELVEDGDGIWTWNGPGEGSKTGDTSMQYAVVSLCNANDVNFSDAMKDAQLTCPAWVKFCEGRGGTWCRDPKGGWRLVNIQPCPDVLSVEYVEA